MTDVYPPAAMLAPMIQHLPVIVHPARIRPAARWVKLLLRSPTFTTAPPVFA